MRIAAVIGLLLGSTTVGAAAMSRPEDANPTVTGAGGSAYAEAVSLIEAEDFSTAVPLLEGVVATTPDNADAWSRLGFGRRKLGQLEPALAAYREALRLEPEHLGANEYLGELYIEIGRLDLARERLAVLERACRQPCEELVELKELIEAHEAR